MVTDLLGVDGVQCVPFKPYLSGSFLLSSGSLSLVRLMFIRVTWGPCGSRGLDRSLEICILVLYQF